MTAHASAPPFASNHVHLLMVGDAHVQAPLIHSHSSFLHNNTSPLSRLSGGGRGGQHGGQTIL